MSRTHAQSMHTQLHVHVVGWFVSRFRLNRSIALSLMLKIRKKSGTQNELNRNWFCVRSRLQNLTVRRHGILNFRRNSLYIWSIRFVLCVRRSQIAPIVSIIHRHCVSVCLRVRLFIFRWIVFVDNLGYWFRIRSLGTKQNVLAVLIFIF